MFRICLSIGICLLMQSSGTSEELAPHTSLPILHFQGSNELVNNVVDKTVASETSLTSGHIEFELFGQDGTQKVMYYEWAPGGRYRIGEPDRTPFATCDGTVVRTIDDGCWDVRYVTDGSGDEASGDDVQCIVLERLRSFHRIFLIYLFPLTGIGGPRFVTNGYNYTLETNYPKPLPPSVGPADTDLLVRMRPLLGGDVTSNGDMNPSDTLLLMDSRNAFLKAQCSQMPRSLGRQWNWLFYRADPVTVATGEILPSTMAYIQQDNSFEPVLKLLPDKTRIASIAADRFQVNRSTCRYSIAWSKHDEGTFLSSIAYLAFVVTHQDTTLLVTSLSVATLGVCLVMVIVTAIRRRKCDDTSRGAGK